MEQIKRIKINGKEYEIKGDSMFIRYSAYADGTDYTETWSEGQGYVGYASGLEAPADKDGYTWMSTNGENLVQWTKKYVPKVATRNILNVNFASANIDTSGNFSPSSNPVQVAEPEYIAVTGGETYTLSWVKTVKKVYVYAFEYKADKSYIKNTGLGATHYRTETNIKLDANCAFVRIKLWCDGTATSFEEIIPDNFQMELGEKATEYILPLVISSDVVDYSPTFDMISEYIPKASTRNIMTLAFVNGRVKSGGVLELLTTGTNYAVTPEYLSVTGGKTYTLSYTVGVSRAMYVHEYGADKSFIKYTTLTPTKNEDIAFATISLDANCAFIRIHCYKEGASWTDLVPENFQMELGGKATPYVKPTAIAPTEIDAVALAEEIDKGGQFISNIKFSATKNALFRQVSHRGYLGTGAPQCTAPAYIEAKKFGFDMGENDMWITTDGVFVMAHDTTLPSDRSLVIAENTYATLYAGNMGTFNGKEVKIMTFEEWLILMKKIGLEPFVDLKSKLNAEQCLQAMAIVRKHGLLDKVIWSTNAYDTINGLRSAYPKARLALLGWTSVPTHSGAPEVIIEGRPDLTVLYPHITDVTAEVVENARNMGVGIECWYSGYSSEQEEETFAEIERVVELGVTGICLDTYLPCDYFIKKLNAEWGLE